MAVMGELALSCIGGAAVLYTLYRFKKTNNNSQFPGFIKLLIVKATGFGNYKSSMKESLLQIQRVARRWTAHLLNNSV